MKLSKKQISWFFQYNAVLLVVMAIVSFVFFDYVISAIDAYKDYEKVDFFIEAEDINDKNVFSDFQTEHGEVLSVNRHVYSYDFSSLTSVYEAFGKDADILILKEQDYIDMKEEISSFALEWTAQLKDYFKLKDYSYYSYEETDYALKIHSKDNDEKTESLGFDSFIKTDTDYPDLYLSFRKDSPNLKGFNDTSENSWALDALSFMLDRYAK